MSFGGLLLCGSSFCSLFLLQWSLKYERQMVATEVLVPVILSSQASCGCLLLL